MDEVSKYNMTAGPVSARAPSVSESVFAVTTSGPCDYAAIIKSYSPNEAATRFIEKMMSENGCKMLGINVLVIDLGEAKTSGVPKIISYPSSLCLADAGYHNLSKMFKNAEGT